MSIVLGSKKSLLFNAMTGNCRSKEFKNYYYGLV